MQMTLDIFNVEKLVEELDNLCDSFVRGGVLEGKTYMVLSCYENYLPYSDVNLNEDLIDEDVKYLEKKGYKFEEFDYSFDEMDVFKACDISRLDMDEDYIILVF